ncbi:MAG TPA: TetR/AcrR family transcriptional regulator [Synergistales bacterium]|jgi:AcrR family transcriptional regulator|nr:TetR/AcrR family transcriptional regulator [Synergistales bacterium]HOR54757.1 TetR/AcrR family transcriptional regulator [Synergistales bacterium]HPC75607.1 TetR/AcrR family transcriptional regulator [Synergistales bacterium]
MGSKEVTRKRILEAVGKILAEEGFGGIGVNSVSRRAGVDKVLIYRYFGDLPGLLREFASSGDYWPAMRDLVEEAGRGHRPPRAADLAVALLKGYLRGLRDSPTAQELLLGELVSRNELSEASARKRERQGSDLVEALVRAAPDARGVDVTAMAALLSAGLTFLMLRARTSEAYLGIDISSKEGWERIERAMEELVRGVLGDGGSRLGDEGGAPAAAGVDPVKGP